MTDDLGPLRRAMDHLAEHGGNPDLYQNVLARSRRLRRRTNMITGGAAAIAVLAVGVGIAAVNGVRPEATPIAVPSASASPSPSPSTSPSPSHSPSPSRSATSSGPRTSAPASSAPASSRSSADADDGCPVRASTLRRVADLPDDFGIDASSVECWRGWASAAPAYPPGTVGDGVIIFRYDPDRGWYEHSRGSAIDCASLGIRETPGDQPPFCSFRE